MVIFLCSPPTHSQIVAGTAILSKHKPLSVDKTLPGHPNPTIWKGRIITLEYPNFYLVGTYVVNAGDLLKVRSVILGKGRTLTILQDPRRKDRME
jgi:exonuclease III